MTLAAPDVHDAVEEKSSAALVELRRITKRYGSVLAVDGVSLAIRSGEVHGLCGHNGAGKSTLVKILSGLIQPDEGDLRIGGTSLVLKTPQDAQAHGVATVDQELSVVPTLTVEENILLGRVGEPLLRHRRRDRARVRELLGEVGLGQTSPQTLAEHLSVGERQLVEIARALGREAQLIILDEPTATLSDAEIERVFEGLHRLADSGRAIVFVSHRLSEVVRLCRCVTVLRDGRSVGTVEIGEVDADRLVTLMLGHVPTPSQRETSATRPREPRLRARKLEVPGCLAPLDIDLAPGEICGVAGQVGSGGSELLRSLAGLVPAARGKVEIDGRVCSLGSPRRPPGYGIAFVSNDRKAEGLFLHQSVEANLTATRLPVVSRGGFLVPGAMHRVAQQLADVVRLPSGRINEPVSHLSGGNQQKTLIGRCLERADVRVLLLDEPTRGVDVGGREEIHTLIRDAADRGVAVLFCSSELDEILGLADTVLTMRSGRLVGRRPRQEVTHERVLAEMTHRESR